MRIKLFSLGGLFISIFSNAQQAVINEKLLFQLTKNQTVRIQSDKQFFNSYEKQQELYDNIKNKITQVVAIQEYIYNKLTNVNSAISHGKKLQYLYQYLGEISTNAGEMLSLSSKNPQYAAILTKSYIYLVNESLNLKKDITETILKEDRNFLMDPYDREILLSKIFERVRNINGTILYIILMLKNGKQYPFIYQIPGLQNYVNIDRSIVRDIIFKYGYLKN